MKKFIFYLHFFNLNMRDERYNMKPDKIIKQSEVFFDAVFDNNKELVKAEHIL